MNTTTTTHPDLPDYVFERTVEQTFNGRRIRHHWSNQRTGDWETNFPTRMAAVANARRFEAGLRAEGV